MFDYANELEKGITDLLRSFKDYAAEDERIADRETLPDMKFWLQGRASTFNLCAKWLEDAISTARAIAGKAKEAEQIDTTALQG